VHTADPKLKSIWPNLKRGKKFVGTLYVLSVVTPQIRSMEFFKASKPLAQSMELMREKQFFNSFEFCENLQVKYEEKKRIHDILVWIRIRGFMPLNNGSGSGVRSGSVTLLYMYTTNQGHVAEKYSPAKTW
jgi:hypothetical protein